MNMKDVINKWHELINLVSTENKALSICLEKGCISEIYEDEIFLDYKESEKFYMKLAGTKENEIEDYISEIYGDNISLKLRIYNVKSRKELPF